jgi:hypothetical protein
VNLDAGDVLAPRLALVARAQDVDLPAIVDERLRMTPRPRIPHEIRVRDDQDAFRELVVGHEGPC